MSTLSEYVDHMLADKERPASERAAHAAAAIAVHVMTEHRLPMDYSMEVSDLNVVEHLAKIERKGSDHRRSLDELITTVWSELFDIIVTYTESEARTAQNKVIQRWRERVQTEMPEEVEE